MKKGDYCNELSKKKLLIIVLLVIILGCKSQNIECIGNPSDYVKVQNNTLILTSEDKEININLTTLEANYRDDIGMQTLISQAVTNKRHVILDLDNSIIKYPKEGLEIRFSFIDNTLNLSFHSTTPQTITWPSIEMEQVSSSLIWPHYEGSYIPLNDKVWLDFLESRSWNTTTHQYMSFWGIERGSSLFTYLVENPFHNEILFTDNDDRVTMNLTHNLGEDISYQIHFDRNVSPITPGKYFRKYLMEKDGILSLKDKMKIAPNVSRLIGAPHAYVWLGSPIGISDIKEDSWIAFAKAILGVDDHLLAMLGENSESVVEMANAPDAYEYLKVWMVEALSKVLLSPDYYDRDIWPLKSIPSSYIGTVENIIDNKIVTSKDLLSFNSYLLYQGYHEYLSDPRTWGNGVSTKMVEAITRDMDKFILTCNGVENVEIRPHVASYATDKGLLFGAYDEYYSIHDPDNPEWPTAKYDRKLYETGYISNKDKEPMEGFGGIGYLLSPIAARPYFEERIDRNFNKVPYSYYFLDCDGWGDFFDDYYPNRRISSREDALARAARIDYIFNKYHIPVGTEGGSYLVSNNLSVAEGVFMPTLDGIFDDPDLNINEMSPYFLGRSFPSYEPEQFFLPVPMKEKYVHLYSDPRFRLPLYEAVFHDSIVTTAHYASSSLKFTNIAETTALTEILYQVAPMYHFNVNYYHDIKDKIKKHNKIFEKTHSYSYQYPLEDFEFLTEDRLIQKTSFGDLEIIANYRNEDFSTKGISIPKRSVRLHWTTTGGIILYNDEILSKDITYTTDIELLLSAINSNSLIEKEKGIIAASNLGTQAKDSIPLLIDNLTNEEWVIRKASAKALANMGPQAIRALPQLIKALGDEEWQVRRPVAYAIASLGEEARPAIPALMDALNDEEWQVRKPVVLALGAIGKDAKRSLPYLKEMLDDPEIQVVDAAKKAIQKIKY
ncbi:glycoside hydrolase [Spirochaeta cellobiosiphila]|uniref:glycoside hydrolase n=1 Tax=Spirochaeta cellobiosiphila TaxID=504483 RepID=UPI000419858D|nr:glycoside hydrolase [Spirochaeta cellobiosiphila]